MNHKNRRPRRNHIKASPIATWLSCCISFVYRWWSTTRSAQQHTAAPILFATGTLVATAPKLVMREAMFQELANSIPLLIGMVSIILLLIGVGLGLLTRSQDRLRIEGMKKEIEQLRRENERAKVVHEMASTLSATLNYQRVLKAILDLSAMGLAEVGGQDAALTGLVLLFKEENNFERLKVHAGRNIPRSDEDRVVSGQSGLIAKAIYTAEPVIRGEVSNDPILKQFVCLQAARSVICAPLRAGFDTYGVVIFASQKANDFTDEHAELLTTFCNQAIVSLKNAQLYQDLQAEQRKILDKESEARHKLARELHDGPTQTISAITMRLNFVRMMFEKGQPSKKVEDEVAKIEELAQKATHEIRTMLFTLRPVVLETQGLVPALEQYADRLCQDEKLNVEVDAEDYDGQLSKEAEAAVFAVIEEAVGNAKKHAHADRVVVRLQADDRMFTAEIQDDGIGFDMEAAQQRREVGHLGLLNMEERARLVRGRCSIQSKSGAGTLVRVNIPLRQWSNSE